MSLVLNGILIGSLTSSVTSMTLPPPVKLYGTKVALFCCCVHLITMRFHDDD